MYQVKELAEICNVPPDTVRHYTRIGLLKPVRDPSNGYRQYSVSDSKKLVFIRKAKKLGYCLKDIEHILAESQKGKSPCPMVRDLISQRIHSNRERLEQLMRLQLSMEEALMNWEKMPDGVPDGNCICHLIESVEINDDSTSAKLKNMNE